MIARRSRQILSPVQQHHAPPEEQDSPLFFTAAQFPNQSFSFKVAGGGRPHTVLSSPGGHSRVSCFVEVPAVRMGSVHHLQQQPQQQPAQQGTGTKRKRVAASTKRSIAAAADAASGSTGRGKRATRGWRGETGGSSSTTSAGYRRGIPPPSPRKPVSTASNNSEWSSVASGSPSNSRSAFLSPDTPEDLVDSWINGGSTSGRTSSRASLRQSMRGMTLEDPASSTGTASGSGDLAARSRGHQGSQSRRRRSRDGSVDLQSNTTDEADEAEDERLLTTAPNWQLSRLKKDDLVRLNRLAGLWSEEDKIDPDLYTKQELVNGIIVCRSRLDKGKNPGRDAAGERVHRRTGSSSSSSSTRAERARGREAAVASSPHAPTLKSRSRSRSQRSLRGGQSEDGREATDRTASISDSEASHEGGGEETEAEPARNPQHRRKAAPRRARPGSLRRMDSSLFEEAGMMQHATSDREEAQQHLQQAQSDRMRRSLRAAQGLAAGRAGRRGRDRSIYGDSDAANASSSSLAFTSSGISPLGSHVLRRRASRRNMFVASSPVRAGSRALGSMPTRRRPVTRATAAAIQEMFGEGSGSSRTPRPARRAARTPKAVSFMDTDDAVKHRHTAGRRTRHASRGPDDMEEDWEEEVNDEVDAESHEPQKRLTRARARQNSLQGQSADDADCELVSQLSVAEEDSDEDTGMSASTRARQVRNSNDAGATADDETPGKTVRRPSNLRRGSQSGRTRGGKVSDRSATDLKHETSLTELGEIEEASSSDASSTEADDSPIKFRKLRNGKLRMPPPLRDAMTVDGDSPGDADDVDMGTADDGARRRAGSMSDAASSEDGFRSSPDLEEAMFEPTSGSLSRLRRAQLLELCQARDLPTSDADRKVDLIDRLLEWYSINVSPPSTIVQDQMDIGPNSGGESDSSVLTAKQGSDVDANTPQTKQAKGRGRKTTPRRQHEPTESEVPLLLRAKADKVQSSKLPTPPLTSNNDEGNAAGPSDGVDELNGLDLESLDLLDKEIPPNKLEKLEKIGSGGFKDVYVGRYRISKTRVNRVAIADIRDQLTEMDIKELSLLRDLRHENIVRFIGVSIPDDPKSSVPCMIVSELCINGDLFDYIRNTEAPSDDEVFRILLETARGLEYLHTRTPAIIHRDCKSTNVLITRNRTAKINDFGLAKVKNSKRSMMRSLVGTVNWQAAELWVPKPHYNEKVDVWSAGMTFWETLQWRQAEKKYPFQGMNEHQIYLDVGQKRLRPYTGAIRRQFGAEIVELLDRMWHQSPKERPSMTEVCDELERLVQMKRAQHGGGHKQR